MYANRRQFIRSTITLGAAAALSRRFAMAANSTKYIPIGFQLYTVRGEFAKDVPGTLKKLGDLGYRGVEFWGYAGTPNVYKNHSATELRQLLDENGLKCCGMHLDLKALAPENFKRTMDNNQELANTYLNLAAAQEQMKSEDSIAQLADLLNKRAEDSRKRRMKIGYHAHPFDFEKINGRYAWEILFSRTAPEITMQMDVGNCLVGHGDPIAMLKEFPGRTQTIHIKEHEDKTFDSPFYKEIFQLCETTSATQWYIVEMGGNDGLGFDVPRQALEKLHRLGK
jgi:sugar phosphate isomerase/epimerase